MKTLRVAVTGGRGHQISSREAEAFREILFDRSFGRMTREGKDARQAVLIHGNCRGVDHDAARLAEEWGYPTVPFEAPWDFEVYGPDAGRGKVQIGPAAGPLRNWMMLQAADLLVAFPGGRGTANCVKQARELGVEVMEVADHG